MGTRAHAEVLNVPHGPDASTTYTIAVEAFGGVAAMMTLPYTVQVRLRPVVGAGDRCDPTGVENRCETGACPMAGTCPPAM